MKKYKISPYIKKIFETSGENTEWGGYYNYSFLCKQNEKMLCHRVDFDKRNITANDTAKLGWYDIKTKKWTYIDQTDSFNWQQGSMLQWVPNTENKKVIFNLSENGRLVSRMVDIETGEKINFCYPIYGLTSDGKKAITLNFERSYWTLAYHYNSVVNQEYNVTVVPNDGIYSLDLETNKLALIVSLSDVISMDYDEIFGDAKHWVEHIMVNPQGTRFVFLHRFSTSNITRATRIFIANIDGSNLQIIPNWREFSWSHFGWKTESEFAIYAFRQTKIANTYSKEETHSKSKEPIGEILKNGVFSFAKSTYRHVLKYIVPASLKRRLAKLSGYQIYDLVNGHYELKDFYTESIMDIDGHPSFCCNGKYMITDSYADEKQYRRLIIYNTENHKGLLLGKFYAGLWGTPAACDLHPKLSEDEKMIVIDTACYGEHRMMVFELDWKKIYRRLS